MTQGNAAAQIGSASPTTDKIPQIGTYVQDPDVPGPGSIGPYFGVQGATSWNYNWLGEEPGFLAPSNAGVAAGKNAQWVTNAALLTVPADGRLAVTGGVATAAAGTGAYKTFLPAGTVLAFTPASGGNPAIQQYFWAFQL